MTGFADDRALVTTGCDPKTIPRISQASINKAVKWASDHGLGFSLAKTAVLFLTRKRKYTMPKPLNIYGEQIPYIL